MFGKFFVRIIFNKKYTIMKELIVILTDEKRSFEFAWWVYMFIIPVALVLIMSIAGWIDTLSM